MLLLNVTEDLNNTVSMLDNIFLFLFVHVCSSVLYYRTRHVNHRTLTLCFNLGKFEGKKNKGKMKVKGK